MLMSLASCLFIRQCSPVVGALALRSRDPGSKTRSDHSLNLFQVSPWFNFLAALVNSSWDS